MPEGYQTTQPRVRGWSGSLPRCLRTNPRAPIVPWRGSTVMNRFSLIELRGDQVGPRCACLLTGSRDTQNTTGTSGVKQTRPGTFVNQAALPGARGARSGPRLGTRPRVTSTHPVRRVDYTPETEHPQANLRVPAKFARSTASRTLCCGQHNSTRLHCSERAFRGNNAAGRSRRGRGAWM